MEWEHYDGLCQPTPPAIQRVTEELGYCYYALHDRAHTMQEELHTCGTVLLANMAHGLGLPGQIQLHEWLVQHDTMALHPMALRGSSRSCSSSKEYLRRTLRAERQRHSKP